MEAPVCPPNEGTEDIRALPTSAVAAIAKDYCVANGIGIVSCSLAYQSSGGGDGEGYACDIVNDAAEKGVLWVNSAGNYGDNKQYKAGWSDSDFNDYHNVSGSDEYLRLTSVSAGESFSVILTWSDEWYNSRNNYDLTLYRRNTMTLAWDLVLK